MRNRILFQSLLFILLFGLMTFSVFAQEENQENPCYQDQEEKLKLIETAESDQYNVKYIEIVGNTYTRYQTFRKHFAFGEGDIFTHNGLNKTIDGFNKVKTIYPISMEDVKVSLGEGMFSNGKAKIINMTFCVKQKEKK